MTAANEELPQLGSRFIKEQGKTPGALNTARENGQLKRLMAGDDPDAQCEHCGGSPGNPPNQT